MQCYYFKWNIEEPLSHLCSQIGKGSLFKAKKILKFKKTMDFKGHFRSREKFLLIKVLKKQLQMGNSVLPAGIIKTEGSYDKGDLVNIVNKEGNLLGKGLSHYNNIEVNLVKGLKSDKIEKNSRL